MTQNRETALDGLFVNARELRRAFEHISGLVYAGVDYSAGFLTIALLERAKVDFAFLDVLEPEEAENVFKEAK